MNPKPQTINRKPQTILSLVWYKVLPPLFGGQKGIAEFNRQLARYYSLTCICSKNNVVSENLPYKVLPILPLGQKQVLNPFYWYKVRQIARQENASVILLEHPYHGLAAWFAARSIGARLIVHSHNIESNRFRQIGKWWWPVLRQYEKWVHRRASLSLFKTVEDLQWAIRHFCLPAEKCMVIPYGVDRPSISPGAGAIIREQHRISHREKLLLFAGTLDYEPNEQAVLAIFKEIAPRLRAAGLAFRIIICGRNRFPAFQYLKQLKDPSVIMAGEVPSITAYFAAADVFINTVASGGGIQTKNLDAIAHGCNTVCFTTQATGIPVDQCDNKLRIADDGDWDGFTSQIIAACKESAPTPDRFFHYFSWDRLLQPLIHNLQTHE